MMPRVLRIAGIVGAVWLAAGFAFGVFADEYDTPPAVSGFNSNFSIEGGLVEDEGGGLVQGSLTAPLGQAFGLQLDGMAGSVDDDFMGGGGAHLFTRDPTRHLFGIYGSYHTWKSIDITRFAGEAELYRGQITFSGIAGWERVDVPGTRKGSAVTNSDDNHIFAELDLSYYLTEDLRLSAGYHYENEENLMQAEFEFMPQLQGVPLTIFATGTFGDDDHTRITGGARFYFGANRLKSLIRRHREDDPRQYSPVFPDLRTLSNNVGGPICGNGVIETGEACDDGNTDNGDGCSSVCLFEPM